jgi:UDPglucose--hexose-1-phosphate uridylyltransferase
MAYRDRLKFWNAMPGISYVNIFKNVGKQAGASLRHCHSQLIATDRIPADVQTSVGRMHRHRAETGCCLHCDLIRAERKANQRVVWQNDSLLAFCPFASSLPMLLRITSQQHQSRFEDLDDGMIDSVSRLVHRAVSWLEQARPQTAYNLCLSTQPAGIDDPSDSFHWSIDLFPRMTQIAGFEWSSGCTINPVLPEAAATCYRKIASSEDPRNLA